MIDTMPRPRPPHLRHETTRDGKTVWYVRLGRTGKRTRVKAGYGTPEFWAQYHAAIAGELTTENPDDLPKGEQLDRVLDAAAGLTRYESEGAFALSLTRHNSIRPEVIWELKSQMLKKNNLLTLHCGNERFDSVHCPSLPAEPSCQTWNGTPALHAGFAANLQLPTLITGVPGTVFARSSPFPPRAPARSCRGLVGHGGARTQ